MTATKKLESVKARFAKREAAAQSKLTAAEAALAKAQERVKAAKAALAAVQKAGREAVKAAEKTKSLPRAVEAPVPVRRGSLKYHAGEIALSPAVQEAVVLFLGGRRKAVLPTLFAGTLLDEVGVTDFNDNVLSLTLSGKKYALTVTREGVSFERVASKTGPPQRAGLVVSAN
jgi:hypothetical protein